MHDRPGRPTTVAEGGSTASSDGGLEREGFSGARCGSLWGRSYTEQDEVNTCLGSLTDRSPPNLHPSTPLCRPSSAISRLQAVSESEFRV